MPRPGVWQIVQEVSLCDKKVLDKSHIFFVILQPKLNRNGKSLPKQINTYETKIISYHVAAVVHTVHERGD